MGSENGRIARFKRDEYTGENRCGPCTVVNLFLAFVCVLVFQIAAILRGGPELAVLGSVVIFAVALPAIYFRGYLVPGTPALTRRYFPRWLLVAFGKDQQTNGLAANEGPGEDHDVDVESVLIEGGVLTESADGDDLRLSTEFAEAFDERVAGVRSEDATRKRLLDVLDWGPGSVEFEEYGSAFRVRRNGSLVGTWESRPAFLADVADAELLGDWIDAWDGKTVKHRGELLNGLRPFLETCPGCSGSLSFGTRTVESCCSTREVAAVTCDDCGARVFETEAVA